MTRRNLAVAFIVLAALLVGLGIFLAHTDLTRGSQLAGILSLFLNAIGVGSGVIGTLVGWRARHDGRSSAPDRAPGADTPAGDTAHTSSIRTGDLHAGGSISIANRDMYFGSHHEPPDATKRSDR